MSTLLLDAGPLVALLSSRDRHHPWAREVLRVAGPVVTCEAVLSEASFLVQREHTAVVALRGLLQSGALGLVPLSAELPALATLMARYQSIPMSFADACLVRLSELVPKAAVVTLDSDFRIYRRNGRQVVPTLMPR